MNAIFEQAGTAAREHALDIARHEPPDGLSPDQAIAEIQDVLGSIGDTYPEGQP
jgi:hypothetical protein